MAEDLTWIPESLMTILQRSESHYRSVDFKRTAHHMRSTLDSARKGGTIPGDFYERYVKLLKDDAKELFSGWDMPNGVSSTFVDSVLYSIDRVAAILEKLDAEGKTPTFSGATGRQDDAEAINEYFENNGGIYDPLSLTSDPYEALEIMDPFYELVYNHVYMPGKQYLVSQLELAEGHESMLAEAEQILSVSKVLRHEGQTVSDFRYAFQVPGSFSDDEKDWILCDDCIVPVEQVARWPLYMYYKVPLITAMLPIHNIKFFSLVQETIAKQSDAMQRRSV